MLHERVILNCWVRKQQELLPVKSLKFANVTTKRAEKIKFQTHRTHFGSGVWLLQAISRKCQDNLLS